jgi:hypothetical protein
MKSKICLSIAACSLAVSLPQAARADSLSLHFRDNNVGVGVNIGQPLVRYVAVAPPPACHRDYGYSGWGGYRQRWVAPAYVYPSGYWRQRPYYREQPRWEEHREHEWRHPERQRDEWRERDGGERGNRHDRDGFEQRRDWR